MTLFSTQLKPGIPVYKQIVYAARKAIVSGQLSPGERFPSVRKLSKLMRINPNTAQKIITALIDEGLLQVHPGIGTVVSHDVPNLKHRQEQLLNNQVEALVVDAKQLSIPLTEVIEAISVQWTELARKDDEQLGTPEDAPREEN